MKYSSKIWIGLSAAAALTAVGAAALRENLAVRHYTLYSDKITEPVKLAVMTDLHSTLYGDGQEKLLRAVENENPDAIVLVGDIVDDRRTALGAKCLFAGIGKQFPCYYVTGNHELGKIDAVKRMIRSYGIPVLEGTSAKLVRQNILIAGVDDPAGFSKSDPTGWQKQLEACGKAAAENERACRILLCHRPMLMPKAASSLFYAVTRTADRCVYLILSTAFMRRIRGFSPNTPAAVISWRTMFP